MARLIVGGIKSTAIAGVSVDNIGSDMGKMLPMNDALAGQYARDRASSDLFAARWY